MNVEHWLWKEHPEAERAAAWSISFNIPFPSDLYISSSVFGLEWIGTQKKSLKNINLPKIVFHLRPNNQNFFSPYIHFHWWNKIFENRNTLGRGVGVIAQLFVAGGSFKVAGQYYEILILKFWFLVNEWPKKSFFCYQEPAGQPAQGLSQLDGDPGGPVPSLHRGVHAGRDRRLPRPLSRALHPQHWHGDRVSGNTGDRRDWLLQCTLFNFFFFIECLKVWSFLFWTF